MSSHWKAVLGIILIFVFGCLSGVLSTSIYFHHEAIDVFTGGPEGAAKLMERRMTHNLVLDENQRQKIHELFMENMRQRKLLQKEIQPQVQTLNRETFKQINAVLRPEQRE